jgi:hypothetical protein
MLLWRRRCGQRCAERDRELPSLLLMLVLTLPTAAGVVGQTFGVTRQAMRGHEDSVNCLDMMPNRALLISGSDDGSARMWDLRTLECVLGFEVRVYVFVGSWSCKYTSTALLDFPKLLCFSRLPFCSPARGVATPRARESCSTDIHHYFILRRRVWLQARPSAPSPRLQCRKSTRICCSRRRGPQYYCSTCGCPPWPTRS